MADTSSGPSTAREAFVRYLRTGRRSVFAAEAPEAGPIEAKFNPYHDPRNGQFTFAPGGPKSLGYVIVSDRRKPKAPARALSNRAPTNSIEPRPLQFENAEERTAAPSRTLGLEFALAGGGSPPRPGGNINAFRDPMTLQQTFPGLRSAPGGSIIAVADNLLNVSGPAYELTASMTKEYSRYLITQIKEIDPTYQFSSLNTPTTLEGQINQINDLLLHRAKAAYRVRGDTRPLEVETLRFFQRTVDDAYSAGVQMFEAGRLSPRLSRAEAIGNYVDRTVREKVREFYNQLGISTTRGQPIRVNSREYNSSGSDRTYRQPDVRVSKIAFDYTLTPKTLATAQVRGFFNADFSPTMVVIVRPTQLGPKSTYAITRPRN